MVSPVAELTAGLPVLQEISQHMMQRNKVIFPKRCIAVAFCVLRHMPFDSGWRCVQQRLGRWVASLDESVSCA